MLPPSRPAELVQDRVRAFRRLVDQLLEISRIDGRAEPIAREPVDLGRLARAVCSARPGVIVHDACAGTLEVDARRLERVIVNLLDNAERHGRPPIEVVVEEASITVRDHGPGFPPAFLERATERFAVADPARSDGAGLGLSIVVEHVRLLEGELAIARHPDGGAIVTVSLPSGKSTVTEAT